MGTTVMILLGYIITFILIIVIISLLVRIRSIERKLVNFTPTEAYTIMENMHEIILESQRLADSLESSIKQKESVLEDLSDLVDEKIIRFERASGERYNKVSNKEESKKEIDKTYIKSDTYTNTGALNQINTAASVQSAAPGSTNRTDKKSKIIMLHNDGRSDIDIARELGISVTEVQLALRLLPKV